MRASCFYILHGSRDELWRIVVEHMAKVRQNMELAIGKTAVKRKRVVTIVHDPILISREYRNGQR